MIVKAIFRNKDYDYFVDKENGIHRVYGDIFMCSDELAEERIKKGLVKKASKKEEKEYYDSIDTVYEENLKPAYDKSKEGNTEDNGETDSNESDLSKNDEELEQSNGGEE